ncbi:hypothetical protein LPJ61_003535 [Coemansia biformis]|uniref:Uncharacterized protein n=1 Tax=Coemansia biformis TaxID=1286918 RepID=A0A9W8CVH1_9FUNG|nr:hypothetical protein LPJ61_003535 [Coemansia biformis]
MSITLLQISFDKSLSVPLGSVTVYANMGDNGTQILSEVNKQLITYGYEPLSNAVFKITNTASGQPVYVGSLATLSSSGFKPKTEPGTHTYKVVAFKEDAANKRGECLIL